MPYVIMLLPFGALLIAGVVDLAIARLRRKGSARRSFAVGAVAVAAIGAVVAVPLWTTQLRGFVLADLDQPLRGAPDWLIENASKLKDIPGWIVQGRFDVVTPMESAWRLRQAWPNSRFEVVWDAGHASTEPGIVDALVRATDQALRL
jgi:pimeloyl-ACP methyl ester carboxylesterase